MGYPDDYVIPVSDTRAYKQFGNSVVVPLFKAVAEAVKPYVLEEIEAELESEQNNAQLLQEAEEYAVV